MGDRVILIWTGDNDETLCASINGLQGARATCARDRRDALECMSNADAFVTSAAIWDRDFAHALAKSEKLSWVQIVNAGFENIENLGVPSHVTLSTWGPVASAVVAEHAVTLLLALMRGLSAAAKAQRRHEWSFTALTESVTSLYGASITIMGSGYIGGTIASLATSFGATVQPVAKTARDGVESYENLPAILERSDALVIAAPLTSITRRLIDASMFSAMKPGAHIVNVARGQIIDTKSLVEALDSGRLAGAALDVTDPEPLPPEHPLWSRSNVIITPHIASLGGGRRVQEQLEEVVIENVRRFVLGEKVKYIAPVEHV